METMETFLERVLKSLERDPPASTEAKRQIKEILVRQPWVASIEDARSVCYLLLDALVKPVLAQDREREADVERLGRQIRAATQLTPASINATVSQIATWIKEEISRQHDKDAKPPETFRERLLVVLRQLGTQDPRLAEALAKLGPPGAEVSWKDLHTLLSGIVVQEDLGRSAWQQERDELKKTLLDMVVLFGSLLQGMGRTGEGIDQAVERLRGSDRLTDLEELRKVLLREAEEFQQYAHSLREQVESGKVMLLRARERLHQMEAALLASQDEQLIDPLSGLPNRFSFSAHLTRHTERALHLQEPFVLLLCRIEGLGPLLDGLSEKESKRLLLALAKRMRGKVEPEIYLARLNVENFAMILPKGGGERAMGAASQIHDMFDALRFRMGAQSLAVRPVFGGAVHHPAWNEQAMLVQADAALTEAVAMKNSGLRIRMAAYRPPGDLITANGHITPG
ncbi:MAG: diguanylate cyclase [Magnetococcales bacterium]|nr:diguanylate cyclase [Magnetococcales bacterium]